MDEQVLKKIPALNGLPILDAKDERARALVARSACELAEVNDPVRLHDILHRTEYRPLAAVRGKDGIRVYFEIRNHTAVSCDS
jgi:hypothetical protein